ncbi:hypothetical protein C4813_23905, partial [Salmonella enterica subsp. enterica serovar Rubislaw]
MWREARLAFTDSLAALDCSVVPAHPWVHGLGEGTVTGGYRVPGNTIHYFGERWAGRGGKPGGGIKG